MVTSWIWTAGRKQLVAERLAEVGWEFPGC
jgi:hypothetical protein